MENKTDHDSVSESISKPERRVESEETSGGNEESCKNGIERKREEATEVRESSEEGEKKPSDVSGKQVESEEEEIEVLPPENSVQLFESPSTPVIMNSTPPIQDEADTCPDPPPRQRRKSRANSDTTTAVEKRHDDIGESKSREEEEEEEEENREERNPENEAAKISEEKAKISEEKAKISEEKAKASVQIEGEGDRVKKSEPEANTNTSQRENNAKDTETRNRSQRTGKTGAKKKAKTGEINLKNVEEGKKMMMMMKDAAAKEETTTKEEDQERSLVGLKKELGLLNCIGVIVGNIIGTGIFVSPRAVLQYTGSVGMSLIVWIVSGFMAIVGAFCYAELGTMIPQSGGNYTYLHESFGPLPAFIYVWMAVMITIPSGRAVVALTFANYVLQPFFPEGQTPPQSALRIVGVLLILLLTYVNCRRVRWATTVQDMLALTKVLALIMIIVVGLFHLARGTTSNYDNPMEGTTTSPALVATAFYHTLYAYDGWDSLNTIIEELKDPFRNLPRAIAISVTIVMIIYVLTNVAYFAVLPKDLMLASPAVAVTFGNLALGVMAWTIPIFVACSITGGLNGSIFLSSRLLFVSARRGHLPRVLSLVHINNNTPIASLWFMACMSMVMFVTSDVRVLINYITFAGNLMSLICVSSFFWFRVKYPDLPRPIKVWIGFPIIFIVLAFFLCVFPVVRQPMEVVAALLVLGSGVPVFYFLVNRQEKPKRLVSVMDKVTYVCQLLFMAAPEERPS